MIVGRERLCEAAQLRWVEISAPGMNARAQNMSEGDVFTARSNRKPPILYFGNDWFAENRTSSHHIARWLSQDYSVYYIECPGLRAPQGSSRDLKKIVQKLLKVTSSACQVPEGLKVKTLFQIPFHRFASVRWLNKRLIAGSIRWLNWREGIKNPISWFTIPHVPSLVGSMGEELSVYYCTDDHGSMTGVNERAVRAMDEETTRRASLVFVTSATLLEGKRNLNPNVFVSPHGVHVEHFGQAQDERLPVAADVAGLPRPVIGFFGLIEPRIDIELIDYLAEQRPEWTFLLIGRVAIPPHLLPGRSNIHFIGKRPYESLPSYGRIFDATIIPYRQNRFNFHANPLKLREYLAMGKPVVSVRTRRSRNTLMSSRSRTLATSSWCGSTRFCHSLIHLSILGFGCAEWLLSVGMLA